MTRAFIGLGSNVGDRLQYLQRAVKGLDAIGGVQIAKVSSVYETEPIGSATQAWFLNAVAEIDTSVSPAVLLMHTQGIERTLNRVTTYRWGPRTIDLDILLYGDEEVRTDTLQIPHLELRNRAFVMIPLLELVPDLILPDGTPVDACLTALTPPQRVCLVGSAAVIA